ncbi:MAG: aminopeptidase N [Bdellovibrionaceae bacterium]|nr:aminopeptidase N [Pseudobdellovibrionaceae bacterium]
MTTTQQEPQKIYLKDYRAPDFQVDQIELWFDLQEDFCRVRSSMQIEKTNGIVKDLVLNGVDLELEAVHINGHRIEADRYHLTPETLTILDVPSKMTLEIQIKSKPQENTSLEGLYKSNNSFTTQCEAQGFRKVTYFIDRPDVMTTYTVHIEADDKTYPVLLSNGDKIRSEILPGGRRSVTWRDPFKKPCYLFALVAGDLGVIRDHFVTSSGRTVNLEIYSAHGTQEKCHFAMESLKKSMKWDEERFGREYDLSTYMIVAMDDFNAGAMENKGLNIFNSRLVLADAKTATDFNYFSIESVVAHEYFHNWTGNRVTLRDWFHLSLKEGLTVFRDQEFSMDLHSRAMIRIDTVADLRSAQFAEDAGPNAHPIRPDSCYAVDNFFTSTIYEKGSEVIRMMQTMVGRPGFRKGMDLYFKRHDGQAVIIEDFAAAIAEPNGQDWSQFKLWYSQAGTPEVRVKESYDAAAKTYRLELEQTCAPSPGQSEKKPFHIPLVIGLLDSKTGRELEIRSGKAIKNSEGQWLLHLKEPRETFEFTGLENRPVLSLNRGFSAPIHLKWDASQEDLLFLLAKDTDAFNRWEAGQKLMIRDLSKMIAQSKSGQTPKADDGLLTALGESLRDESLDPNLKSKLLEIPPHSYLWQLEDEFAAEHFEKASQSWMRAFAVRNESTLLEIYKRFHGKNDKSLHHTHMAERKFKNTALMFLSTLPSHLDLIWNQLQSAAHMTDYEAAFALCLDQDGSKREDAIQHFLKKFEKDSLTMNKWFALQASAENGLTAETVQTLWSHPQFNAKNPNRVYSLLGRWGDNLTQFHAGNGRHYQWLADRVLDLDRINPQVATRIAGAFDMCAKVNAESKAQARRALDSILDKGLSKNSYEVVSRSRQALN